MAKRRKSFGRSLCWISGILVISVCLSIIAFLVLKGAHVINWDFLTHDPEPSLQETLSGGIRAPLLGTVILITLGISFTVPWALATAIYLAEYSRDSHVMRVLRMGIDVLSGVPTIVFAIFGLAIFTNPQLGFFSTMVEGVEDAKAFGRSFFVGALTMAAMVLPFVVKSMEEALRSVPFTYREASYALGASKWATITKVVIPAAGPGIITGVILGIGRIAGDTAIVWLCLGGSMVLTGPQPWWQPANWLDTLQNTGSTLTSYIYYSSPAGEGNSPNKAFGAGLVLITIVLALNAIVDYLGRFTRLKEE